jgi:hypothetical protein
MYIVGKGHAFTSKRGMIREGEEITEKDFASHDAFVKAMAKKKIIAGENNERIAADEKAKTGQDAAAETAKQKKETAERTLKTAKEMLAGLETELANSVNALAQYAEKAQSAASALTEKRVANKEIDDAYCALARATDGLKVAKKGTEKTAAEGKVAEAKAALSVKENTDEGFKAAAAELANAQNALETAETSKAAAEAKIINAKEAVALAEADFAKIAAELSALEGN